MPIKRTMTVEERRNKRNKGGNNNKRKMNVIPGGYDDRAAATDKQDASEVDGRLNEMLQNWRRDDILKLVAKINNVYRDNLGKDAPFMTYVIIGMQSTGKSTIVERILKTPLNIVQDGTGTRCPLYIIAIHDSSCATPNCNLRGEELEGGTFEDSTVEDTFRRINRHTKKLNAQDRFSTKPLHLEFRADNVQNMCIVDLPGIITNQSAGTRDNRDDITKILKHEMAKSNTKLCVLLEPTEFATNAIIDFCDGALGGREGWIPETTFLMTKFDKQMSDTFTGTRANNAFKEFHRNRCFPFLVSTPILGKPDLPPGELYQARLKLLQTADAVEERRFNDWTSGQDDNRKTDLTDEILLPEIRNRTGFAAAEKHLQKDMLKDIISKLPDVVAEMNREKVKAVKELDLILQKQKLSDARELKKLSAEFLTTITGLVLGYLKGDLQVTIEFPDSPVDLEAEIQIEEESDWTKERLSYFAIEKEEEWRGAMACMFEGEEGSYPQLVQPDEKFFGGKQIQRALEFSRELMIRAIPSRNEVKPFVANCTGYGTSENENWERAMLEVVQVVAKQACHPVINFTSRHCGSIFRQLLHVAMEDAKTRGKDPAKFNVLPQAAEKYFVERFEKMVWKVMEHAAETGHSSVEPLYKRINLNLPGFEVERVESEDVTEVFDSGEAARDLLIQKRQDNANVKRSLLPAARTFMVTKDETEVILERSYKYAQALMGVLLFNTGMHFEAHLLEKFKADVKVFATDLMESAPWEDLAKPDPKFVDLKTEAEKKVQAINESLEEVERLRTATLS